MAISIATAAPRLSVSALGAGAISGGSGSLTKSLAGAASTLDPTGLGLLLTIGSLGLKFATFLSTQKAAKFEVLRLGRQERRAARLARRTEARATERFRLERLTTQESLKKAKLDRATDFLDWGQALVRGKITDQRRRNIISSFAITPRGGQETTEATETPGVV